MIVSTSRRIRRWLFLLASLALTLSTVAIHADIGVVIADPTTVGAGIFTNAGHSLVYLSGVCPDSPIHARLCRPGEQGSIVSTYPNFRESRPYAWNMIPLNLYVEGLMNPDNRLLYASRPVKTALEITARIEFFRPVCAGKQCPEDAHSYWRDLVASTADRDVFIYAIRSTRAQDEAVVHWLNASVNVNHYQGITNNCAMFTRSLINAVFPHSIHRDLVNDLGMMSPKSAARSFSHWAHRHPELDFYSLHFAQKPGSLPRCGLARSGTEQAIHTKKYLIPAAMIGDHEVAGSFFVAYMLTGRFNLYKEYTKYPQPSVMKMEQSAHAAKQTGAQRQWHLVEASIARQRTANLGTPTEWAAYREEFAVLEAGARKQGLFSRQEKIEIPKSFATGSVTIDENGNPWLILGSAESQRQIGLTSANLFAPGSDPRLAVQLMMGRVAYALTARKHMREDLELFQADWNLLQMAYQDLNPPEELAITPSREIPAQ